MPSYGSGDYRARLNAGLLEGNDRRKAIEEFEKQELDQFGNISSTTKAEQLKNALMDHFNKKHITAVKSKG